jgi:DNA-binding XRE family transcriptional regulator
MTVPVVKGITMVRVRAKQPSKIRKSKRIVSGSSALRERTAKDKAMISTMAPGQKLKSMRERAGVSQQECAKALGMATPSGYGRYENDATYNAKGEAIPGNIIAGVATVLVGRGYPPVTLQELMEISDSPSLMNLVTNVAKDAARLAQNSSAPPAVAPRQQAPPSQGNALIPDDLIASIDKAMRESVIRGLQMACDFAEDIAANPMHTKQEQAGAKRICVMCQARIAELQQG